MMVVVARVSFGQQKVDSMLLAGRQEKNTLQKKIPIPTPSHKQVDRVYSARTRRRPNSKPAKWASTEVAANLPGRQHVSQLGEYK